MNKISKIRVAAVAVGVVILERMGDELVDLISDGLLTNLIQAIFG